MSLTKKLILLAVSATVLLFLALAFAHQYEHHDHGNSCAVCQWVSRLALILPQILIAFLFCRRPFHYSIGNYLLPQLLTHSSSSRSPPF
ncbi:MAG: hypothetical protein A2142_04415 [candidate division Zixibacteria bacterium RBG_16_48_11]|nr:MAG: hypothetical protein A2142_04415 [candidate division Zixibacteria bacterium RBG_16_48_11]